MQNKQNLKGEKEFALQQVGIARSNLLLMIALTVVNIVLLAFNANSMLLFSATVPYFAVVLGMATEIGPLVVAGVVFAVVILAIYLLCWVFSKKHYGWMIAALVFFIIDSLAMVGLYILAEDFSGILDLAIHIWVLYYLIIGVKYGYKLKHLSPEEELEYEETQPTIAEPILNGEVLAMRVADTTVKSRVLIEGDYFGHHITYRRVKRINELVIDGYVYDDVEMLVEVAHSLQANVDGHHIQVGFDGVAHSYIRIDGQKVAKKLRLY